MDIQRLRNLTTGRLHTKMSDIYEDIELITGAKGIMTHQLPNACKAMQPYLKEKVPEERFWEDKYDPSHTGEVDVPVMSSKEQDEMFKTYSTLPSPLAIRR